MSAMLSPLGSGKYDDEDDPCSAQIGNSDKSELILALRTCLPEVGPFIVFFFNKGLKKSDF